MKILLLFLLIHTALPADLVVSGGYMTVTGGSVREHSLTDIQSGATVFLASGSEWISPAVSIQSGGILESCGIVTGSVVNEGLILADCGTGSTLTLTGDVDNRAGACIRAENGTGIAFTAALINNGILDLIFSPSEPPAGMTGSGTSVTASTLPPLSFNPTADRLIIRMYNGHTYRVEYTDDLTANPVIWTQEGSGFSTPSSSSIKNFPITPPAAGVRVYRYVILNNVP